MSEKLHPYDLLTEDENSVIFETREIRRKMINQYIEENGIPTKAKDMRVLNEILNSLDNQVLGLVDRRLKNDENKNEKDLTNVIREIFLRADHELKQTSNLNKPRELEDTYIPTDIVPGETKIEYEEIELEEIIGEEKWHSMVYKLYTVYN